MASSWGTSFQPGRARRSAAVLALGAAFCWPGPAPAGGPWGVMPPFRPPDESPTALRADWPASVQRSHLEGAVRTASTGNVHLLVILAEFADKLHRCEPARFAELLFGAAPSLRDYYDEVSRGALALSGDLYGWVTLPGSQLTYSNNVGGIGAYPNNAQKMTEDAVEAAIAAGLDLADYDADGDGAVDALLVIHSGQGLEWSANAAVTSEPDAQAIQSHMWSPVVKSFGAGLPQVTKYFTCPELQLVRPRLVTGADSLATIGVYCHEFGHMMGLPDFYDTATFENRVGVWAIMDYGSWNSHPAGNGVPGDLPAQPTAWSKMFLGWAAPAVLSAAVGERTEQSITLSSASAGGAPLQLLANPAGVDWSLARPGSGEYFLAEVRTREGYDAGLPADGLILYHVDESREDNDAADNPDGGGLVLLLPQDGRVNVRTDSSATDPWPGVQTTFGETSSPSSALHDGSASGVSLSDITNVSAGSVSFTAIVVSTVTSAYPYVFPNPWHTSLQAEVEIILAAPGSPVAQGGRLLIYDVAGRLVRTLGAEHIADGRVARWNARTSSGQLAVPGYYFLRLEGGAGTAPPGRLLLIR